MYNCIFNFALYLKAMSRKKKKRRVIIFRPAGEENKINKNSSLFDILAFIGQRTYLYLKSWQQLTQAKAWIHRMFQYLKTFRRFSQSNLLLEALIIAGVARQIVLVWVARYVALKCTWNWLYFHPDRISSTTFLSPNSPQNIFSTSALERLSGS